MAKFKRPLTPLEKKARRGFRGYPVGTVAFYGPDDTRATKVAVGIVPAENAEPTQVERWFNDERDARADAAISKAILDFLAAHGVRSVALTGGIIGCPHEEGVDYPEGQACPRCPFWVGRDRWTGRRA